MAVVQSRNDGDYVARFASGAYKDTASAAASVVIGFQPRKFVWMNKGDGSFSDWHEGMAAGAKRSVAAAGAITVSTTLGFTWDATLNAMRVDASLVTAGADFIWEAWA